MTIIIGKSDIISDFSEAMLLTAIFPETVIFSTKFQTSLAMIFLQQKYSFFGNLTCATELHKNGYLEMNKNSIKKQ